MNHIHSAERSAKMDVRNRRILQIFGGVAVLGLLFTAGCASSKMTANLSGEKIFKADRAVLDAKEGNASVNAPKELMVAEEKLVSAKTAFSKEDYDAAANLAELAVVDAAYAGEKATTQKNFNMLEAMKKENDVLRQEIEKMSK
jgi:hypothetical protein